MNAWNWSRHVKMPELWPLFACMGVAGVMSSTYLFRLATKGPEVSWSPTNNKEPWQVIPPGHRIKMMGKDLSDYERPAPNEAYEAIGQKSH